MKKLNRSLALFLGLLSGLTLVACDKEAIRPGNSTDVKDPERRRYEESGKLFGDLFILGGGVSSGAYETVGGNVNLHLWRAAVDTTAILPITSADPYSGVILTDWFTPKDFPTKRYKLTVRVLSPVLRADALQVTIHQQEQTAQGQWLDVTTASESVRQLEDAILTRARELKREG